MELPCCCVRHNVIGEVMRLMWREPARVAPLDLIRKARPRSLRSAISTTSAGRLLGCVGHPRLQDSTTSGDPVPLHDSSHSPSSRSVRCRKHNHEGLAHVALVRTALLWFNVANSQLDKVANRACPRLFAVRLVVGSLASNVAWLRRRLGCGMWLNRSVRRHFVFLNVYCHDEKGTE